MHYMTGRRGLEFRLQECRGKKLNTPEWREFFFWSLQTDKNRLKNKRQIGRNTFIHPDSHKGKCLLLTRKQKLFREWNEEEKILKFACLIATGDHRDVREMPLPKMDMKRTFLDSLG